MSDVEYTYGPRRWTRPRWPFYVLAVSALALVVASIVVFILCVQPWGYLAAVIYSFGTAALPVMLFLLVALLIDERRNYQARYVSRNRPAPTG